MNILKQFLRPLIEKELKKSFEEGVDLGKKIIERDKEYKRTEAIVLKYKTVFQNKPIIGITEEWEDPVIGTLEGVDNLVYNKEPIPIVKDYITGVTKLYYGRIYACTWQKLNKFLEMNPYERWAIFTHEDNFARHNKPMSNKVIHTKDEIMPILKSKGFLDMLTDYNSVKKFSV